MVASPSMARGSPSSSSVGPGLHKRMRQSCRSTSKARSSQSRLMPRSWPPHSCFLGNLAGCCPCIRTRRQGVTCLPCVSQDGVWEPRASPSHRSDHPGAERSHVGGAAQKCGLVYPVRLAPMEVGLSQDAPPSPPPAVGGQGRRRHRQCRRRSPSTGSPALDPTPGSSGGAHRRLVHSRLGPLPSSGKRVPTVEATPARGASPPTLATAPEASSPSEAPSPTLDIALEASSPANAAALGRCLRWVSPRPMARGLR